MLAIRYEKGFKKSYKRVKKRGYNTALLYDVIQLLIEEKKLPEQYRDHALVGFNRNIRECHITPDWLLVYEIDRDELILYLVDTGSHSDLFR